MLTADRISSFVARSNATVFDIGANDGSDTIKLARAFPFGRVIAFEPDPRAAQRFRERIDDPQIQLIEKAVGAQTGHITFHQSGGVWPHGEDQRLVQGLPEDWDQSGSIRKPKRHLEVYPWCTFDNTIKVLATTLDDWVSSAGIKLIDFIWADVQGAEIDLILGGQSTLRWTRYLYTEFSDKELYEGSVGIEKIKSMLPNYEILEIIDDNVLLKNRELDEIFKD